MLTCVFPAFNEAENLRRFPNEVLPVLDALKQPYEVLVVDDGSTDGSAEVAEGLGEKVRVVRHGENRGLGAAIRTAIRETRGELVVTMDTDLTFAPTLVPRLLERFEKGDADVVIGSPKLAGFGDGIPAHRILISKAATLVYSTLLGDQITAVSPIFRLYRRADLVDLPLQSTGFDINAEILFHLIQRNLRVVEIPAPLTQRIHGETKLNYRREILKHLKLCSRMVVWKLGGKAPKPAVHEEPRPKEDDRKVA